MGIIGTMHASIAALELRLQQTKASEMSHAELVAAELEQLRLWRLENRKRYIKPTEPRK